MITTAKNIRSVSKFHFSNQSEFRKRSIKKKIQYAFTLLEVMIAIVVIGIVSTTLFYNFREVLEKKRFRADISKLFNRIELIHQMAYNTQTDWEGVFKNTGKGWEFTTYSVENEKRLSPLNLKSFKLIYEGKEIKEAKVFFFSNGEVIPNQFILSNGSDEITFKCSSLETGDGKKKLGPIHPDEA